MSTDIGDIQEIVSLQSFISELESELHSVGVEMEEEEEEQSASAEASNTPSSAQAKENVTAFIQQMEMDLGIEHGDYSNILSPSTVPIACPVKTGTPSVRSTPLKVSQSHLHFVQRIESKLQEEEEREEAMTDVCVTTKYGELREYLSSPAVVHDARSSSSAHRGGSTGTGTADTSNSPHSSVYSLHVNSEAKGGVDALFDSLKVKNLDLHYGSPDGRSPRSRFDIDTEGAYEEGGATGGVGAGRKLNHSINRSLEFSSPTRVSTGFGPSCPATSTPGTDSTTTTTGTLGLVGTEVDSAPGTSTHKRDNSNANTIYGKITPQTVKMLGDERINNDYDDWHSGTNMELAGIQRNYSGLYGTLMSTTGNYTIVHGIEIVLRPDVSLMAHILPALQRTAEASKLTCEVCQSSHVLLEQRSAVVVRRTDSLLSPPREGEEEGRDVAVIHNLEWDCIDIQVCVSRALKHRVLLCQFFKKLSPFVAPPDTNPPLSKESGYEFKPHTFQFLKILRRMFTLSALSLSCLYSLPLEHLGGGNGNGNGNGSTNPANSTTATATARPASAAEAPLKPEGDGVGTLAMVSESGAVYDVPYLLSDTDTDTGAGAVTTGTEANSRPRKAVGSTSSTTPAAAASTLAPHAGLDYHYVSQLEGMFREDMWKYLREAGKVLEESYKQSEADCATLLTALQPIYKQHDVPLPAPPPRVKLADIPMNSAFKEEEADVAVSAPPTPSKDMPPLDSMTVIALLLKELWNAQKKRCDVEIKARLTQKNRHLVNASYSFTKYKGLLISTLASGPGRSKAAKSSLNSAFVTAYMFTAVTEFCSGSEPSEPVTASSSKGNSGNSGTGAGATASVSPAKPPIAAAPKSTSATLGGWLNSAAAYVAPLPPPRATDAAGVGTVSGKTPQNSQGGSGAMKPIFSLGSPPIVMFWCSCLVTTTPGTLYFTAEHLYVQYGFAFLHQSKEAYSMSAIDNCQEDRSANVPTLKISLGGKKHQLSITPIGVECSVLRTVLYDLLNYNTHDAKPKK